MKYSFVIAMFVFIVSTLYPMFSYADSEMIKRSLYDVKWIMVDKASHVKLNYDKWNGTEDLSFRYKIMEEKGSLCLWVDVTDDKVFLKDADTIVSDHVEIWLADPRLSELHKKSIVKLEDSLKILKEALANKDENAQNLKESITFTLSQINTLKKMYVNNKYFTQLIFNNKHLSSSTKGKPLQNIFYEYLPTKKGYEFVAKIPLNAICDYKSSEIGQIKYLIDIVDIDSSNSSSQKTLISSSSARTYSKPDTFNNMNFDEPYFLSLSKETDIQARILSNGYLKFIEGSYKYYSEAINSFFGGLFLDSFDYPGFFKPPVFDDVSSTKEMKFYCNGTDLNILSGKNLKNIDFNSNTHIKGNAKCKILFIEANPKMYYTVLEVTGSSKHYQGSGQCGAGEEASIIWIGVNKDLKDFVIESFPFLSCISSIDTEERKFDSTMLQIKATDFSAKKIRTMKYVVEKPEKGLTITEQPLRDPASPRSNTSQ